MSLRPTEEECRRHVGTKFVVRGETPRLIELELAEVKGYIPQSNEVTGMERFSLYFYGPNDLIIQQGTIMLGHPEMGEVMFFMVPVGLDPRGFRYEVVFNYFKDDGR